MGQARQKGKKASDSPTILVQLRNALVAEWNNIADDVGGGHGGGMT